MNDKFPNFRIQIILKIIILAPEEFILILCNIIAYAIIPAFGYMPVPFSPLHFIPTIYTLTNHSPTSVQIRQEAMLDGSTRRKGHKKRGKNCQLVVNKSGGRKSNGWDCYLETTGTHSVCHGVQIQSGNGCRFVLEYR